MKMETIITLLTVLVFILFGISGMLVSRIKKQDSEIKDIKNKLK